jgi:hypothetical protein
LGAAFWPASAHGVFDLLHGSLGARNGFIATAAEDCISGFKLVLGVFQTLEGAVQMREVVIIEIARRWRAGGDGRFFIVLLVQAILDGLDGAFDIIDGLLAMALKNVLGIVELLASLFEAGKGVMHVGIFPVLIVQSLDAGISRAD